LLIEGAGLAGAASLAGRGVGRAAPARQATPAAAEPVTNAEVSGQIRYLVSGSGPEDAQLIQGILDEGVFRDRYPNLTVTVEPAAAAGGNADPLLTSMISGEAPDIFDTWTSRATPYIGAEQILDLAPLMERDYTPESLADFFPWVLEAQTLPNGLQWGMPRYVNLTTLVYNQDMIEEAGLADPAEGGGWNQDSYRAALVALTRRAGDRTRVFGGHVPVFNYGRFAHEIEGWGAAAVDPADPTRATFDSPQAQECAEWHRALMLDERAIADKSFLETGGGENVTGSRANFAAGRIATMEEGFYPFALADAVGDSFRFGFAPPPAGPAGRPVQGSADGFSIWQGSPNQEAAWEAVKFMAGPEFQQALAEATGLIPVRRSLIPAYRDLLVSSRPNLAEANVEVGLELLETGNPHERPLFARGGTDYAADAEVEKVIVNPGLERIFVVGDTPVTFLTELATQVTEAMRA
jgi:ABC-type glycerol-3-phosphate transport system substrate-binding protein